MPIVNTNAVSQDDRVIHIWTSDGYPEGWGNLFKVYIDDDPNPVCTITPKNYVENEETHYQADFQWEHRYKAAAPYHSDDTQPETGVPYTEATLNGCAPHNYRVSMTGTTNSRTTKTNTT